METNKEWYAVYTKPRWEKKVAELLTRKKLENFCPLNKVVRQWKDRKKVIHEPLFTSYVFLRLSDVEIAAARDTEGVLNFVYWLGKPAIIKDAEINAIKDFLNKHQEVKIEKIDVNLHDNVRITGGPLKSLEGEIQEIQHKTVKVYLPSLGYMLLAEVDKGNIEVLSSNYLMGRYKAS